MSNIFSHLAIVPPTVYNVSPEVTEEIRALLLQAIPEGRVLNYCQYRSFPEASAAGSWFADLYEVGLNQGRDHVYIVHLDHKKPEEEKALPAEKAPPLQILAITANGIRSPSFARLTASAPQIIIGLLKDREALQEEIRALRSLLDTHDKNWLLVQEQYGLSFNEVLTEVQENEHEQQPKPKPDLYGLGDERCTYGLDTSGAEEPGGDENPGT